jgi:hypothetical protein
MNAKPLNYNVSINVKGFLGKSFLIFETIKD